MTIMTINEYQYAALRTAQAMLSFLEEVGEGKV